VKDRYTRRPSCIGGLIGTLSSQRKGVISRIHFVMIGPEPGSARMRDAVNPLGSWNLARDARSDLRMQRVNQGHGHFSHLPGTICYTGGALVVLTCEKTRLEFEHESFLSSTVITITLATPTHPPKARPPVLPQNYRATYRNISPSHLSNPPLPAADQHFSN